MRLPSLFAFAALAFALSPLACATGTEDTEEVAPAAEQELRTTLTEKDDGKTITVSALLALRARRWTSLACSRSRGPGHAPLP